MRYFCGLGIGAGIGVSTHFLWNALTRVGFGCCGSPASSVDTALLLLFFEWPWTLGAMAFGGVLGCVFADAGDTAATGPRDCLPPQ